MSLLNTKISLPMPTAPTVLEKKPGVFGVSDEKMTLRNGCISPTRKPSNCRKNLQLVFCLTRFYYKVQYIYINRNNDCDSFKDLCSQRLYIKKRSPLSNPLPIRRENLCKLLPKFHESKNDLLTFAGHFFVDRHI